MNTIENQYVRKFRDVLRKFEREIFYLNTDSCCNGVTLAQCHTLLEIEKSGNISVTDLAKNLSLDKSTVSRTVDGLFNIGLVNREVSSESRRITTLSLTSAGKKACDLINTNNDKYLMDTLSVLDEKEQKDMLCLFEKITDQMVKLRNNSSCSCC